MVYNSEIKENDHLMDGTMYALMAPLQKFAPLAAFNKKLDKNFAYQKFGKIPETELRYYQRLRDNPKNQGL